MSTAYRQLLPHSGTSRRSHLRLTPRPATPQPGPDLVIAGRYRLVRKLGEGGMASVWLAHDRNLERDCAVKLMDSRYLGNDELLVRFASEARATARVRTPHVVELLDNGIWRGLPFITMEYLDGENLLARLSRLQRLNAVEAYRIVAQIARGLTRVHAAGIIHRDIKPSNIMLTQGEDGEIAKIIDFGVASDLRFDDPVDEGQIIGTPAYMSPEQARGATIDWRSDLWSLGVLAFECLTGQPLFEAGGVTNVTGKVLYKPLPKLTEVAPELPEAVNAWFERALSRKEEERFQSAKELADALGSAIGATTLYAIPDLVPQSPDSANSALRPAVLGYRPNFGPSAAARAATTRRQGKRPSTSHPEGQRSRPSAVRGTNPLPGKRWLGNAIGCARRRAWPLLCFAAFAALVLT